jgi:hypothetical protein
VRYIRFFRSAAAKKETKLFGEGIRAIVPFYQQHRKKGRTI